MANEATVNCTVSIKTGNLDYVSRPGQHNVTVTGVIGPTPGAISVDTAGTDVDLSQLTTPGLAVFHNLDATNYVELGAWDPENSKFFPLFELKPGEQYAFRLSRDVGQEYGTGTGTTGPNTNTLRLKADTAACVVVVEAFED